MPVLRTSTGGFYVTKYNTTTLTSLSKLLYTTTGSYDTTYNYNAVTKYTSDSKLVIAYYSHLMKFDSSTNTMTAFSKTTAATYPFSM